MYPRRPLPASRNARKMPTLRFPDIRLELLEDLTPTAEPGFLRLLRHRYSALYPDGTRSAPFVYDSVDRDAIDAVVLAAHYVDAAGQRRVFLRSCVRPPVAKRDPKRSPRPEQDPPHGWLWELPAGLIETSEQTPEGLLRCAQREIEEELGFRVELSALSELGTSIFPVPGFIAERQFFFEVEVDPSARREPTLDGSALEHFGEVEAVGVTDVLELCRQGVIPDGKTELAVRRLIERHGAGTTP
jgi:ADP-ribose pyrophosphatase